jgi:hypothetical protein
MGNCADRNGPALLDIMRRLALNWTVINNTYNFGFQLKKIKNNKSVRIFQVCHTSDIKIYHHQIPLSFMTTRALGTRYDLCVSTPMLALSTVSNLLSQFLQVGHLLCKVIFIYCTLIISYQS